MEKKIKQVTQKQYNWNIRLTILFGLVIGLAIGIYVGVFLV